MESEGDGIGKNIMGFSRAVPGVADDPAGATVCNFV
jgi:hypothetical protein